MIRGKVSVVMPAFNESEGIVGNITETMDTLTELGFDFEIIVVDDGSHDKTYLRAAEVKARYADQVRVVWYDRNRGKGNALVCGTRYASGDYVVFLDADMDLHPVQLPVLFGIMEREGVDVVIGSKLHPLSEVTYPVKRRIFSAIYYGLVRMMFGLPVRDTQTGLKLFKIEVLRRVFPRILVKRFAFDIEVLANAYRLGYRIAEAPITLTFQRRYGRINWHDAFVVFRDTLAIFYRMHIIHYYDRVPHSELAEMPDVTVAKEVVQARTL